MSRSSHDAEPQEIQTLSTRVVYENRWMKVREDVIVRQNGSQGIYRVVNKKDFAVIVPFLGDLFAAYGYSNQRYDVFLAQGLSPTAKDLDPEEARLVSKPFTVDEVKTMILDGRIKGAGTVAVFGLLQLHGMI